MQAEQEHRRGQARLIAFRVPGFEAGFVAHNASAAGDAFPQARVRQGGREGRFDDIVGHGFLLVMRGAAAAAALAAEDQAFWHSLGGRVVRLGDTDDGVVADVEGHYGKLMDEYGCDIIVKRPDYHIFGACRTAQDLPALLSDMREQLRPSG